MLLREAWAPHPLSNLSSEFDVAGDMYCNQRSGKVLSQCKFGWLTLLIRNDSSWSLSCKVYICLVDQVNVLKQWLHSPWLCLHHYSGIDQEAWRSASKAVKWDIKFSAIDWSLAFLWFLAFLADGSDCGWLCCSFGLQSQNLFPYLLSDRPHLLIRRGLRRWNLRSCC